MDVRDNLIKTFKVELFKQGYDVEETDRIINRFIVCLDRYDVTEKVREVVPYGDESVKLLRFYCATLLTEGKSKKTVQQYHDIVKMFLDDMGTSVKDASTMDVRMWLAKKQQKASQRTAENYRSYLSSFYKWLYDEGLIESNPMAKVKPIKYQKKSLKAFSKCDIDALRNVVSNLRDRAIIELLLSSGIRVSELVDIKTSDIDLSRKEVFIRNGKGAKQRRTYFDELTEKYLRMYLDSRRCTTDYLFSKRNGEQLNINAVEKMINRLGVKANVEKCHPHRFRRTFATRLSSQGMNLKYIQTLMGHENLNVTMEYIAIDYDDIYTDYRNKLN